MANVLNQNLAIIGKALDDCEDMAATLLLELFPDTVYTNEILKAYETTFGLKSIGDYSARRNAVIAAHRARGGLSLSYYETLGNTMGLRQVDPYTVTLVPGTGLLPFVVHEYSPLTSPQGPATLLPGAVTDGPWTDTWYTITVYVVGTTLPISGPEVQFEKKFNALVPAHCNFIYNYS